MAKRSGGRIFLIVLGFLVLAGGIASITLGLIFVMPDIAKIFKAIPTDVYYIAGGVVGLLLSITILLLGFKRANRGKSSATETFEKNQDFNSHNTTNIRSDQRERVWAQSEKERVWTQSVICEKCGTENVQGDYYCSGCKCALKKICKLCGHDNPSGTEVCEGCGKVM